METVIARLNMAPIFGAARYPKDSLFSVLLGMFVVDDDSVAFVYVPGSTPYGISCLVVNFSGDFTYYATGIIYPGTACNIIKTLPIVGGVMVLIENTETYAIAKLLFNPQNLGLNNYVPIPLKIDLTQNVSTPCYGPANTFFYDPINQLLGGVAYDPVGQNGGPTYSATWDTSNLPNMPLLTAGFVGDYYGNSSPYDLTKTNLNYTVEQIIQQTNGISSVMGYDSSGNYFVVKNLYDVNPGKATTDCVTPNLSCVTSRVSTIKSYFVNNVRAPYLNNFDTNVPGLVGGLNTYGSALLQLAVQIFDQSNNMAEIDLTPQMYGLNVAITNKNLFLLQSPWTNNLWAVNWPSGQFPQNFANGPQNKQNIPLVNLSRPVSPLGAFRT